MRTCAVLAFVLLNVLMVCACGNDAAPPRANPSQMPPVPPPALPPGVPEGLDPAVVRAYEEASVPPPVPFAVSKLRAQAGMDGAFAGLPAEGPENLRDLLSAFAGVKAAAEKNPGKMGGGAAGPSLEPSREELRFAELTERIVTSIAGMPVAKAAEAWRAAGLTDAPLTGFTLVIETAKVFGSGYMETVDARPVEIAPPK